MRDLETYTSDTFGLWLRFIVKCLILLAITYWISAAIIRPLHVTTSGFVFRLILLPPLMFVAWRLFKENPLQWSNTVVFDFNEKSITIVNMMEDRESSLVLDYDGKKYAFSEIDNYAILFYSHAIFRTYYLVKIFVEGKEIKLLSFKEPTQFASFISVLKNQVKL